MGDKLDDEKKKHQAEMTKIQDELADALKNVKVG